MLTGVGVILITLAAASACFATLAETCTMGNADSLGAGIVLSVPLYLVGVGLLLLRPLPHLLWISLAPALIGIAYQTYWSVRFFVGYYAWSQSACDLIAGPVYEFDGREPFLTAWWLGMSVLVLAGLVLAWRGATPGRA